MWRVEGVDLRVHHGVNGQDVGQSDLLVVVGRRVGLVQSEAFGVQSPVVFLALCVLEVNLNARHDLYPPFASCMH